ncbi:MAG TPA: glycosyltransferase family 2 protein, partial [Acidimicrobiia bacterium]|nr:glycosyltransferase family 2 protein [Acidimicrobiia bacterium]
CRRGRAAARGRYLVLGDADGSYDFSALPLFIEPLISEADMVIGSRLNDMLEPGAMPWLHLYVGNPSLTRVFNRLFSVGITDTQCGLRSITRDAYQGMRLASPGMEFASEFLIEAVRHRLDIMEVPIAYRRRFGGVPKLRTFRDGARHLRLMLAEAGLFSSARDTEPGVVFTR